MNKSDILSSVGVDGLSLENTSEELKNDRDVVLAAVRNNGSALKFASEALRNDEEVVKEALKNVTFTGITINKYETMNKPFKDLTVSVGERLKTIGKEGYKLSWSKVELRGVVGYVPTNRIEEMTPLRYASEEIRNSKELVILAAENDPVALRFANERLRNDKNFIMNFLKKNKGKEESSYLFYVHEDLQNDKEVVIEASKATGLSFVHCSDELKNDPEFVIECIKNHNFPLRFASDELNKNREFILSVLKVVPNQIFSFHLKQAVDADLLGDVEFMKEAVKIRKYSYVAASQEIRDDEELAMSVLDDVYCHTSIGKKLRGDVSIARKMMDINHLIFRNLSKEIRGNREFAELALLRDGSLMEYASDEIKNDTVLATFLDEP